MEYRMLSKLDLPAKIMDGQRTATWKLQMAIYHAGRTNV